MSAALAIVVEIEDPATGEFVEHKLPTRFAVCHRCQGEGTHVNPSIDGHGISADEFAEDPDFEESYRAGHYDVQCEQCEGLRVVPEVDEDACSPEVLAAWREKCEAEADYAAECAAERRMGA